MQHEHGGVQQMGDNPAQAGSHQNVGNHVENDDDMVKTAIKQLYNVYLSTTVPNTSIKPQIPHYGFVLRSQIVKVMPDLRITVCNPSRLIKYSFAIC